MTLRGSATGLAASGEHDIQSRHGKLCLLLGDDERWAQSQSGFRDSVDNDSLLAERCRSACSVTAGELNCDQETGSTHIRNSRKCAERRREVVANSRCVANQVVAFDDPNCRECRGCDGR